ncbi:MAG: DUF2797 domain-containing protein [Halanaeroarchaeum sp.]
MQIVGYRSAAGEGGPALEIAQDGSVRTVSLEAGTDLTYALGDRHCAGTVTEEGHVACSNDGAPRCEVHTSRFPCARCTGTCAMPTEVCHEEHALYLAAFAPRTVKVGVTRSWRLETRLREQGADRGAHLRTVENGRVARQIEADMADRFPDRVRVARKIETLHRSVDVPHWRSVVSEFDPIDTVTLTYGLDLDVRPVAETVARGTVQGTKGRILVLSNGGTTYAVDLRDLVGHEVKRGREGPALQSSFDAFS